MKNSPIEWTDDTDNIIVVEDGGWWCRMCSPGCANCYSADLNQNSFFGGNHLPYSGQPPKLKLRRDLIDGWQRQTRPRRHFVASMTDVFGEWVEREWIFYFLDGMAAAPSQTFQVLTKRPAVAAREIAAWVEARGRSELPTNIWIGTSVEDQQRADERIPYLLSIPAAVRFLSCEPLLGPLDFTKLQVHDVALVLGRCWDALKMDRERFRGIPGRLNALTNQVWPQGADEKGWLGGVPSLGWVIAGGESGPKARPMHPEWPRALRDQCATASTTVPFFFKQWGAWLPAEEHHQGPEWRFQNGEIIDSHWFPDFNDDPVGWASDYHSVPGSVVVWKNVGKKAAGRLLDGREHNQFPQLVTA